MTVRGVLFLVVGPSGVGKDSLLAAAQERLSTACTFPRRIITRPEGDSNEAHIAVTAPTFERMVAAGAFALHWRAHGLNYALPASVETDLASGLHVVANVSRAVLDCARQRFAPVAVLSIRASVVTLRARLLARGREAPADVDARVGRAAAFSVQGDDVHEVHNDGDLDAAIARFMEVLTSARQL